MKTFGFWDYVILTCGIIILIWALLKSFGLIYSPIWTEMIPYYGIGITVIAAIYKLGKFKQFMNMKFKHIDFRFKGIEKRLDKIENKVFK